MVLLIFSAESMYRRQKRSDDGGYPGWELAGLPFSDMVLRSHSRLLVDCTTHGKETNWIVPLPLPSQSLRDST